MAGKAKEDEAVVKEPSVADLRAAYDAAKAEQDALAKEHEAYREEHAVKDIPNHMGLAWVTAKTKTESARLALSEAIKAAPPVVEAEVEPATKKRK